MSLKIEQVKNAHGATLQLTNHHGRQWNIDASALDGDLVALGQLVLAITAALAPSEVQLATLLNQGRLATESDFKAHQFTTDALAAALAQGLIEKTEVQYIASAEAPHWRRHERDLAKIQREQSAQALLDELLAGMEITDDGVVARASNDQL